MTCCHVPSPLLLHYLARLTKTSTTFAPTIRIKQQQRCFSRSDRCCANASRTGSSRYARSPRAVQNSKEIGSFWATSKFGHTPNLSQSLRPYADVLTSNWVKRDLQHLGLHSPPGSTGAPQYITSSFVGTWMNGLGPKGIAEWFSNDMRSEEENLTFKEKLLAIKNAQHLWPLADPTVMGAAIYILAWQFMTSPHKDHRTLGEFMMKVAVLLRNRDATLQVLVSNYRRQAKSEPGPQAHSTLSALADQGDISAVSLLAEMLMWPKNGNPIPTLAQAQQAKAYDLALEAFERSEAGPAPPRMPPRTAGPVGPVPNVDLLIQPAFRLLQRMCNPHDKDAPFKDPTTWKTVVEIGAREYDDPDSCALAISPNHDIIRVGTTEWIKFATKAAMDGHSGASFWLGQYYLEHHGWYPPKRTFRNRDPIGFHWMEIFLWNTVVVDDIKSTAHLMALLLRENGQLKAGRPWFDKAMIRIEAVAETKYGDREECSKAVTWLQKARGEWYHDLEPTPPTPAEMARFSKAQLEKYRLRLQESQRKKDLPCTWTVAEHYPEPLLPQAKGAVVNG